MKKVWKFLRDPFNLTLITSILGGLFYLIDFLGLPNSDSKVSTTEGTVQRAQAVGGTAVNATDSAQVSLGIASLPQEAGKTETSRPHSINQSADASQGGNAINAAGSARVQILGKDPIK